MRAFASLAAIATTAAIGATQAPAAPHPTSLTDATATNVIEQVNRRRYAHTNRYGHAAGRGCCVVQRDRGTVAREGLRVPGENISSPLLTFHPGAQPRSAVPLPGSGAFEPTPLQTIQSGTRPLRSGESTRVDPLRAGPKSPTPSGVHPLSSERQSTGSSSSPFSLPSGGSPFSGSSSGGLR